MLEREITIETKKTRRYNKMEDDLFTWYTLSDTLSDLKNGLALAQISGAESLLILTCQQNYYPEDALNTLLCNSPKNIFGGIYPMITFYDTLIKQGAVIIGFKGSFDVTLFPDMHLLTDEVKLEERILSTLEDNDNFNGHDDFLMFYDGLSNNVEDFIDCLFECLDHSINIAGGGAGHLDFIQRPCIFTNQGLHSSAVLLVTIPRKLKVSVAHGWKIFQGPFLVSEAEGQIVKGLNYRPAFEVYNQIIEKESDFQFQNNEFFDIAKHFPLGIEDINNDLIVRDPIVVKNNHIQCVGNVPINSMVYLLEGDTDTLVESAENAAISVFSTSSTTTSVAMVFDCISRVLYLEDEFDKELSVIAKHCTASALFGVLSIGEIANSQSGAIRLLNKSTVISLW